jgi:hypothetical protein
VTRALKTVIAIRPLIKTPEMGTNFIESPQPYFKRISSWLAAIGYRIRTDVDQPEPAIRKLFRSCIRRGRFIYRYYENASKFALLKTR